MKIDIIQTAMVATSTEYEIPGGDIEPENTFNWELDYEETSNKVVEALKEIA